MTVLRPYRAKCRVMGQTSPPGLGHEVVLHVVGESVADVGCGSGVTGYVLRAAWEFTDAWERERVVRPRRLIGVDWSASTLEGVQRHNPYDELHLASSTRIPLPDDEVDTALSMENLEHLLPHEVAPALAELARIARRRIVLSTPAPWTVVNVGFLENELREAEADETGMPRPEFLDLVGRLHKSSVTPEQMRLAGFTSGVNRVGAVAVTSFGAIIYTADPERVEVDRLGVVAGVAWPDYPQDDGREDWRDAYAQAVRDSLAIPTPRRAPATVRVSALVSGIRRGVKA